MTSGGKTIVWLATGFALTLGSTALANSSGSSSDGPYRAIVERNVFDLRPIPPQAVTPDVAAPPPNVKFVGVMRITDQVQGVFSVQDPTPGKQPVSYILSQDQRQGTLEVKSISMTSKPPTAHVQIGNEIVELKLDENPKMPGGPGPAPAAGLAAGPGQRAGARGRGAFPMPAMPVPGQPAGAPSASYSPGVSPDAGNGALPTRPVRTDGTDTQLTAEQQQVAIEQNREAYRNAGSPLADLLPPTQVGALMQNAANAANAQNDNTTTTPASPASPQGPAFTRPHGTGTLAMPGMP